MRPGQQVQLQVDGEVVIIGAVGVEGGAWLATHQRARERGSWVIDPAHWDGLPDGHTRAVVTDPAIRPPTPSPRLPGIGLEPLASLLTRRHADIEVAARSLTDYHTAALTHPDRDGAAATNPRS